MLSFNSSSFKQRRDTAGQGKNAARPRKRREDGQATFIASLINDLAIKKHKSSPPRQCHCKTCLLSRQKQHDLPIVRMIGMPKLFKRWKPGGLGMSSILQTLKDHFGGKSAEIDVQVVH